MASEFPIADVISVSITRETLFPTIEGFGTILIVGTTVSAIHHGERVRFYTSIADVGSDFASSDEEYIAATAAFSQNPKPARIAIGFVLEADAKGFMRGGAAALFSVFEPITDGSFTISIDGVSADLTLINFASDASLADVAATLQVALRAIGGGGGFDACTVSDESGRLQIESGTAGATSTVSALTPEGSGTDLSGPGFINALMSVATIVDGVSYVDLISEMTAIEARNDDWYGLALTRDLKSVTNYQNVASWVEARKKLFAAFDDSLIALDAGSVLDLGFLLKASGYVRTFVHWNHDEGTYPEISELARLATVDYEIPNAAITLKFQQLPGIAAITVSTSERTALLGKNYEIYVQRGGVTMTEQGKTCSGEFIDVIHGVDWIGDTIAIRVFGELYVESNKVAMTDSGVARLQSKVKEVLDTATDANLIATDFNDDGELQPSYTISTTAILNHPQAQRALRIGPPITFRGRLSGAIHSQAISGVVTV